MRRAVLADTGPLYAAVDRSDQYHDRAQDELAQLADEGQMVLLVYPLLAETYTIILRRLGRSAALRFLEEALTTGAPINPEPSDYARAAIRLRALQGHDVTLFDAVLAQLSDRLELPVWTYDSDFGVMGTDIWS